MMNDLAGKVEQREKKKRSKKTGTS